MEPTVFFLKQLLLSFGSHAFTLAAVLPSQRGTGVIISERHSK